MSSGKMKKGDEAKKEEVIADTCSNAERVNNVLIKEELDQTQDIHKSLNVNSDKDTEKDPNSVQQTSCCQTNKHTLSLESSNENKNSVLQPTSRATDKQSNISVTHDYTNVNVTEHGDEQLLSVSSRSSHDQLLSVCNRSSDDKLLSVSNRSSHDKLLSVSNRSSNDKLLSGSCLEHLKHQIVSNIEQCSISAQKKDESSKRDSEKCLDDDISKSSVNLVDKECSNESPVLVKESSFENKTSDKQISEESEIIVKDSSLDNKTLEKETSHKNKIKVEDLSLRNKALEILTLNENEIIVKDSSFENKRTEKVNLNKIEIIVKDSSLENKTSEKETSNENETIENQSGLGDQSEEDSVGFDYSGKEEESEFTKDDNVPKSVATKLECDNKSLSKIADSEIEQENNGTGQLYIKSHVQPLEPASSSCLKDGGSDKKQNQQITDSKSVTCDKTVQIGQGFSSKHNSKNIQARRLKLDALVANIKSLKTAELQDNLHDEVDASLDTPLTKVLESSSESDQDTSHYISNSTIQVKEEKKDQSECVKLGNSTLSETSESEEKIIVDKNFEKVEGQSSVLKTKIKVEDSYCCANVRVATDLNFTKAAENLSDEVQDLKLKLEVENYEEKHTKTSNFDSDELNKSKVSEKKNDEAQDLIKNRTSDSRKGLVSNENSVNEVEDFKLKALTKSGDTKNKVEDLNPNNTSYCDNASLPTDNTKSEIGCEDVDEDIEIDVENLDDISDNLLLFQNADNNKLPSDNIDIKSDSEAEIIKDTHHAHNESGEKSKPQFLKPPIFHFDSQGDKKISDVIGNKQAVVFLGERVTKDRSVEEANKLTKLTDLSQDSNQDETSKLTKLANVKPKKPVKKIEMIRQPVRRIKRVASLNALAMVNILFGKEESPRSQKSSESKVANKKVISNKSLSKAKMLLEAKVKSILKKAKSDDQFSENVRVKKEKTSPGKITQIQKSLAKLTLDSPPSKLVTKVVSPKMLAKTSPSKSPTKLTSPCKSPSKVSSPSKSPTKISPPKSPSKVSKSPAKTKPKTSAEKTKTKNLKEAKIGKKKIGDKKEAKSKISDSGKGVNKKKLLSVEDKIKKPRKKKGELMRAARTHSFPEAKTKSNIASSIDTSKDQNGAKCVNCQNALTGQSKIDSSNSHKQDEKSAGTYIDSNVQYNMGHIESGSYSTHSYGVIQNLTGTCVHCSQNIYSSQGPSGFIGGIMGQPGGLVSPCPTFTIGSVPMVQYHHPFSAGYPIQYQSHNTLPHCGCPSCYYYTPTASPLHHDTCHHNVPPPSYTALRDVNDPGHTGGRDSGDPKRSSLQNIGDSTHALLKEPGDSSHAAKLDEMDPEIDVVGNATSFHPLCNSFNTSKGCNEDLDVEIDVVGGVPPLTFCEKDIIIDTVKKKKKKENEIKTPKSEKSGKKKDKPSTSDKENKAKSTKKRKDSEENESDKNVKRKLELKEGEEKSKCSEESPKTTKSTKKKSVSESSGEIITKPSKKKSVSDSTDDTKKVKKKSSSESTTECKIKKKSTDEEKTVKNKSLSELSKEIKLGKMKSLAEGSNVVKTGKKKRFRESSEEIVKKKSLSELTDSVKTGKKKSLSESSNTVKTGKRKSLSESGDEVNMVKKKSLEESPNEVKTVKKKSSKVSQEEVKTGKKKSSCESPDENRPAKKKKLSLSSEEINSSKKSPKTPTVDTASVKGGKKKTVSKSENQSADSIQRKPNKSLDKVENKKPTKRKSTDDVFTNDSKSEAKQRKISKTENTKSSKDKVQLYNRSKSVDAKVLKDKNEISKTYPKRRRVASIDRQLSTMSTESVVIPRKKSSSSTKITSAVTNEKKKTEIKKVKKRNHNWDFKFPPEKRKIMVSGSMVERQCYPAIIHTDGDIIYIRDVVILRSGPRKTDIPYLGKVTAFWEENDEMMMGLLWYYHPEHTDSGRLPHHLQNEIFASKHRDENSVACIDDRGYVLTYNEYCRYRAEKCRVECNLSPRPMVVPVLEDNPRSQRIPVPDVDSNTVYMCRQVYDFKLKRILKNPS